jgi:hypothetical protein
VLGSAVLGAAAVALPGLGSGGGASGGGGGSWWGGGWNPWSGGGGSGGGGNAHGVGALFDLAAAGGDDDGGGGGKGKKKKGGKKKKKKAEQQPADEDDGMDISESEDTPNVEEENRAAMLITSDTQLEENLAAAGIEPGEDGKRHGTHRCVEVRVWRAALWCGGVWWGRGGDGVAR